MLFLVLLPLLAAVWLWLIHPRMPKRSMGMLTSVDFAHRGLWNDELPENSLPAFLNAAEHGFGIELDVHLTADDRLAVIHDDELHRMCPDAPEGLRVADCTLDALKQYHLRGADCTIPELTEVLHALNGRCPLIVELKTGPRSDVLCERVFQAMQQAAHGAPWCMESFDPRIVLHYRLKHPQVIRGQLAYRPGRHGASNQQRFLDIMFGTLLCNVLSRPDFVAWDHTAHSTGVWLMLHLFRPHMAVWTVRSPQRMEQLRSIYDIQIFEGFIPKR